MPVLNSGKTDLQISGKYKTRPGLKITSKQLKKFFSFPSFQM